MGNLENPDLSVIILNYNVKDLLIKCLDSIFKNQDPKDNWQIIVVDNGSEDGSVEAVREKFPQVELLENRKNIGFSAGNNVGIKKAKAPYVLFLNPDTVIVDQAIQKSYQFMLSNPDIGALTCRVELPDGRLDYSCHRGFPTPWNAFCYFTHLAKVFPYSSLLSGYTATYLDIRTAHEIDCATGAFLMVRKIAGDQINWWDEDYFWNGEDIEFCYNLKEIGWQIWFYPEVKIIHYKGSSVKQNRLKKVSMGVSAMRIFYKKHYYKQYPPMIRDLILAGVKMLEHYRRFKIWVS